MLPNFLHGMKTNDFVDNLVAGLVGSREPDVCSPPSSSGNWFGSGEFI